MIASRQKIFKVIVPLMLLAGVGYVFRDQLHQFFSQLENKYQPCQRPITYSIGRFDAGFGISKADFLSAVQEAVQIWQNPIRKKLFASSDKGNLTINLIYDFRQEATVSLQKIGVVIHDDENTYNILKTKYDSLQSSYSQQKADLEAKMNAYQVQKNNYESQVAYWNSQGGAPEAEYNKLEQERNALSAEENDIIQAQDNLNVLVGTINATATVLNRLVYELNFNVNNYNYVGTQRSSEFQEGEYKSSAAGNEIDIYQFDDRQKLVRVLAHELGHALGLDHLNNPNAIMYKFNQGSNDKLTSDDIADLKSLCEAK